MDRAPVGMGLIRGKDESEWPGFHPPNAPTMPACHLRPDDQRKLISAVGEELVRSHGKQKYYKPAEIRKAAERRDYPIDIHCWAMCIFSSPQDFKDLHDAAGEACDYAAMKAEVLANLAEDGLFSLPDIDLSWLEWPDIDVLSWFDGFSL